MANAEQNPEEQEQGSLKEAPKPRPGAKEHMDRREQKFRTDNIKEQEETVERSQLCCLPSIPFPAPFSSPHPAPRLAKIPKLPACCAAVSKLLLEAYSSSF